MWVFGEHCQQCYFMLSLLPSLIIPGSLDSRLCTPNNHDKEKKRFSVLRKLGKCPNLKQILVTLIPHHWYFSLIDTRP